MREPPFTDDEIRAAIAATGHDAIAEAIKSQEPMVAKRVGDLNAVHEVMSDLAEQVLRKLPQFEVVGRVSLAAWVNGFARNILNERARQQARARDRQREFEDGSLIHAVVVSQEPVTDDDEFFLGLIDTIRDHITAQPGGAQRWEQLVTMAAKPERGRAAREETRERLAELSGMPVEMFGTEPHDDDPEPVPLPEQVAVAPELTVDGDGYQVACTVCGTLGAPVALGAAMVAVREHRVAHNDGQVGSR